MKNLLSYEEQLAAAEAQIIGVSASFAAAPKVSASSNPYALLSLFDAGFATFSSDYAEAIEALQASLAELKLAKAAVAKATSQDDKEKAAAAAIANAAATATFAQNVAAREKEIITAQKSIAAAMGAKVSANASEAELAAALKTAAAKATGYAADEIEAIAANDNLASGAMALIKNKADSSDALKTALSTASTKVANDVQKATEGAAAQAAAQNASNLAKLTVQVAELDAKIAAAGADSNLGKSLAKVKTKIAEQKDAAKSAQVDADAIKLKINSAKEKAAEANNAAEAAKGNVVKADANAIATAKKELADAKAEAAKDAGKSAADKIAEKVAAEVEKSNGVVDVSEEIDTGVVLPHKYVYDKNGSKVDVIFESKAAYDALVGDTAAACIDALLGAKSLAELAKAGVSKVGLVSIAAAASKPVDFTVQSTNYRAQSDVTLESFKAAAVATDTSGITASSTDLSINKLKPAVSIDAASDTALGSIAGLADNGDVLDAKSGDVVIGSFLKLTGGNSYYDAGGVIAAKVVDASAVSGKTLANLGTVKLSEIESKLGSGSSVAINGEDINYSAGNSTMDVGSASLTFADAAELGKMAALANATTLAALKAAEVKKIGDHGFTKATGVLKLKTTNEQLTLAENVDIAKLAALDGSATIKQLKAAGASKIAEAISISGDTELTIDGAKLTVSADAKLSEVKGLTDQKTAADFVTAKVTAINGVALVKIDSDYFMEHDGANYKITGANLSKIKALIKDGTTDTNVVKLTTLSVDTSDDGALTAKVDNLDGLKAVGQLVQIKTGSELKGTLMLTATTPGKTYSFTSADGKIKISSVNTGKNLTDFAKAASVEAKYADVSALLVSPGSPTLVVNGQDLATKANLPTILKGDLDKLAVGKLADYVASDKAVADLAKAAGATAADATVKVAKTDELGTQVGTLKALGDGAYSYSVGSSSPVVISKIDAGASAASLAALVKATQYSDLKAVLAASSEVQIGTTKVKLDGEKAATVTYADGVIATLSNTATIQNIAASANDKTKINDIVANSTMGFDFAAATTLQGGYTGITKVAAAEDAAAIAANGGKSFTLNMAASAKLEVAMPEFTGDGKSLITISMSEFATSGDKLVLKFASAADGANNSFTIGDLSVNGDNTYAVSTKKSGGASALATIEYNSATAAVKTDDNDAEAKAIAAAIDGNSTAGAKGASYLLKVNSDDTTVYVINAGTAESSEDAVIVKLIGVTSGTTYTYDDSHGTVTVTYGA